MLTPVSTVFDTWAALVSALSLTVVLVVFFVRAISLTVELEDRRRSAGAWLAALEDEIARERPRAWWTRARE